jgi:hypothetical protein
MGAREGAEETVEMYKGAKVKRKNKGTSGRVDWWARRTGGRDTGISGKVQRSGVKALFIFGGWWGKMIG